MKAGLTTEEANQQLLKFGYNVLPQSKPKNIIQLVLVILKEPMFILIILSSLLYIFIGDYREGIVMLTTILIIVFITFYQYRKTEKALNALKKLASPQVTVIRDGRECKIDSRYLVPGDIQTINEGDRICADAIILNANNLHVDESILTGESLTVGKGNGDRVFSGTMVIQGKAILKVHATGLDSALGRIALSIKDSETIKTNFQKELQKMITNFVIISIFICISIVCLFYLTRGNFVQSLLNGLAAAMAILPEEFPVVMTIFLALGAWRLSKKNVLTRMPSAIETLGSATVLCADKTGTITQDKMEVAAVYNGNQIIESKEFEDRKNEIANLITHLYYASQSRSVDPTEKAIETLGKNLLPTLQMDKFIKEYPLSKELLAMTRVSELVLDDDNLVSSKGAPEAIFKLCNLSKEQIAEHTLILHKLATQGYRILGVAEAKCKKNELPEKQQHFDFKFLGLVALHDPIRQEVPKAIEECNRAGVRVIMITGDYPETARSIASQIGINAGSMVVSGKELAEFSDKELENILKKVNVFARILPEQKLRIVKTLKAQGEVVAMTGDGVNDAPALKSAHIGIAMGIKGTEVARESSSLVLMDDNFASIVSAIRLGRQIYDNIQKAMSYIVAIHIPIIGLTLMPAFIPTMPLLLYPLHIIFMELIIDPVCSIAFESEQEEYAIMDRPPRPVNSKFFGWKRILFSSIQGFLLLLIVVLNYYFSIWEGHTENETRAIVFATLICGNIFLILSKLSKTRGFIAVFSEKNYAVMVILSSGFILLVLSLVIGSIQKILKFESPSIDHFLPSIICALILLFILESMKFFDLIRTSKKLK